MNRASAHSGHVCLEPAPPPALVRSHILSILMQLCVDMLLDVLFLQV